MGHQRPFIARTERIKAVEGRRRKWKTLMNYSESVCDALKTLVATNSTAERGARLCSLFPSIYIRRNHHSSLTLENFSIQIYK